MLRAGPFRRIYDPSPTPAEPWYINDHCFIRGHDGLWHMFGITHPEPAAPLDELFLAHATSPRLDAGPWTRRDPVLHADRDQGETHVWAPHIVVHDGRFHMFYCAGGADHSRYRIHLATSDDLTTWTRHPDNPMVVDGFDARDPMVLRLDDRWIMLYTATTEPAGGHHTVTAVTSTDLIHWTQPTHALISPRTGRYGGPTESPFLVRRGHWFYLLVCTNHPYNHTAVYRSPTPTHFDPTTPVAEFPAHAAEVIHDPETNRWYLSRAGWGEGGLYLAPLEWDEA